MKDFQKVISACLHRWHLPARSSAKVLSVRCRERKAVQDGESDEEGRFLARCHAHTQRVSSRTSDLLFPAAWPGEERLFDQGREREQWPNAKEWQVRLSYVIPHPSFISLSIIQQRLTNPLLLHTLTRQGQGQQPPSASHVTLYADSIIHSTPTVSRGEVLVYFSFI